MTREEAINILKEVKELDDSMYQYMPAYMNALDMAIRSLESQQWIPCSERLPEEYGRFLVSYEVEDSDIVSDVVAITHLDKYGFFIGHVKAWMPLPKPYEEVEE